MTASPQGSVQHLSPPAFAVRLFGAVVLIDLFVIVLSVLLLMQSREQYQDGAKVAAANLAQVLEQNIAGMVGKVDIALRSAQHEVARQLERGPLDAALLTRFLEQQQQLQPEMLSLRVADAHGLVRYGKGVAAAAQTTIADRDYFQAAQVASATELVLSKPVFARISKKWAFVMARRIELPGGEFGGVVYVNIALEDIANHFSQLNVGKQGSITLRDADLGVMVRYPGPVGNAIGNRQISPQFQELLRAGRDHGTYLAKSGLDDIERIFAYRKIGVHPLYIIVGLSSADFLADWRNNVYRLSAMLALFVALTGLAAWLLMRNWRGQLAISQALAEQEAKFRTVADHTYDWEYWQGPDGDIRYMTPSCERITGYPVQAFMDDPGLLARIVHPDDQALYAAHLEDCACGTEHPVDFRIVHANGETRWIAHGCQAVFDAAGQPAGRRGSNRDVTAAKHAEAVELRLLASLRQLSEVAALSHLPLNEQFHRALATGCELFGLEFGIVSRIDGDTYQIVAQVSPPETLRDGQVFPFGVTYCSITLDKGEVLAIADMGRSSYPDHPCYREFKLETYIGAPVLVKGQVYGTVNFSSPHPYGRSFDEGDEEFIGLLARWVGSAIERDQDARKLAESQLQLQTIIDNEPECVKLLAVDGTLLQMNRAGLCMLQAEEAGQLLGKPIQRVVAEPYRDAFMALTRRVFQGEDGNLEFEVCGLRGQRRWLDTHAVPLRDAQGRIAALLAVTRDITERKNAENQLQTLNATLEQRVADEVAKNLAQERLLIQQSRLAAMGEMIGNIAHQWRQPLNALGLLLVNIKDAYDFDELDDDTLETSIKTGRRLIERMSTTIDDFRNFFKPNKERVAFSVNQALAETLDLLSGAFKTHNIELTLDAPEEIATYGYPNEYSQVILNLLTNAKDAILARDPERGAIAVRIERQGDAARLSVRDNGGGVPDEILQKVFDPYFTTKEKGTGIGLYMSKLIVEDNMGGRIEARNVDEGAEFSVATPLAEATQIVP